MAETVCDIKQSRDSSAVQQFSDGGSGSRSHDSSALREVSSASRASTSRQLFSLVKHMGGLILITLPWRPSTNMITRWLKTSLCVCTNDNRLKHRMTPNSYHTTLTLKCVLYHVYELYKPLATIYPCTCILVVSLTWSPGGQPVSCPVPCSPCWSLCPVQ